MRYITDEKENDSGLWASILTQEVATKKKWRKLNFIVEEECQMIPVKKVLGGFQDENGNNYENFIG